ncbi:hypothetical protein HPB51_016925 [Rhipicephalus microplus]|uniref:Uncharacterized protein n=1 Tax=Rhipicephalus microplus TaxID=6941 RepID=A0A9J6F5W6_RHIMP|nr:hypothetical protein HPB51_016925 [Rhipicephalus microplus]
MECFNGTYNERIPQNGEVYGSYENTLKQWEPYANEGVPSGMREERPLGFSASFCPRVWRSVLCPGDAQQLLLNMQRRNTDPDQARRNARADRASPSTASVGSASSASKNTNRAHDTSALTSRLKHLDDCMRQVKSLMKNLEKSEDPMAQQQLVTLHQMLDQLNIEHANTDDRKGRFNALDLRQRHLNERLLETGGREASPASASGSLDNGLNSHPADDPQYAQLLQLYCSF